MKKFKILKRINCLLVLLSCVVICTLGCGSSNTPTKDEKKVVASKSVANKKLREVKVSKPNKGGLKQELCTKATVSTLDKKQLTFEVPASQLQGLKVGDSLVINNGKNSYPATILNIPPAQPVKPFAQPAQPVQSNQATRVINPNLGSKVIVTAQVGPGINLPGNKRDYSITYLYNNRDTRTHYIKKDYVYYEDSRPFVYITGPDKVVRRKYIRTGLINRYYAEILDELDATERIVENYVNDYVNNVVIPEIVEDYTNQVVDAYQEYIDSLSKRWDYDEDVNSFTIDVNDVDWDKLEDQDIILSDDDIIEILDQVQDDDEMYKNMYSDDEFTEESTLYGNSNDDGNNRDDGKDDDKDDDKDYGKDEETDYVTKETSNDNDKDDDKYDHNEETSESISYKSESIVESTTEEDDENVNNTVTTTTTYDNDNYTDNSSHENTVTDNDQHDEDPIENVAQDDVPSYNDSNDNNNDNSSYNDTNNNDTNDDDTSSETIETTTIDDDNNG